MAIDLDDLTLVITANGYKAGTLYSLKPYDGTGDASVTRSTTATRTNSSGLIETVSANVPRLDYTNVSCPAILVEAQSTNLTNYSEQFDNAYWSKNNATVTADNTTSPDGTTNADKIALGGTDLARVFKNNIATSTNNHTFSIWIKGTPGESVTIEADSTKNQIALTSTWTRHEVTNTNGETQTTIRIINRGTDGDNATDIYVWGAQLEEGSTRSSYIKTEATSVTRNADVIEVSGLTGTSTLTETFEDDTTNVISNPSTYTMSNGRIKKVERT